MTTKTPLLESIRVALEQELWRRADPGLDCLDRFGDVLSDEQLVVVVAILEDQRLAESSAAEGA